jgi:hypothetical protein
MPQSVDLRDQIKFSQGGCNGCIYLVGDRRYLSITDVMVSSYITHIETLPDGDQKITTQTGSKYVVPGYLSTYVSSRDRIDQLRMSLTTYRTPTKLS